MKKSLLLLALASMGLASANAAEGVKAPFAVPADAVQQTTLSRASGYDINFGGELETWFSTGVNNVTVTAYIYITPEIATSLAGNQLTEITFSCALEYSTTLNGSVFVSEDINGTPVTSTAATIINSYRNSQTYDQTVALTEPYTIKEGVGFYFGYEVKRTKYTSSNADYPIGVCGSVPNSFSGTVSMKDVFGASKGSFNLGEEYGYNLYLNAKTVGEKTGLEHVYTIGNCPYIYFTLPVLDVSNGLTIPFELTSWGVDPITSVDYTAVVGGNQVSGTAETLIEGNSTGYVMLNLGAVAAGRDAVSVKITKVNDAEMTAETQLSYFGIDNPGYERKFVVEEGTGTWCGYCPRGIVGLEGMSEMYPEKFIGIAVHSGDSFEVSSYAPLIEKFFDGFPSCVVNRDKNFCVDPSLSNLYSIYNMWADQTGAAEVYAEASAPVNGSIDVNIRTTYAFSEAAATDKYKLAVVLVEDGLTGSQTNNYAGGSPGSCGGWENYSSPVTWTYKDTARGIYQVWGYNGTCPENIVAGEDFWTTLNVPVTALKNIDESRIVVLLLDAETGIILNATSVKGTEFGTSAVSDIEAVNDAPAVYYNMQGMQVANPQPGRVYIIKQGETTHKALLR